MVCVISLSVPTLSGVMQNVVIISGTMVSVNIQSVITFNGVMLRLSLY
jgi:hypothetical protein